MVDQFDLNAFLEQEEDRLNIDKQSIIPSVDADLDSSTIYKPYASIQQNLDHKTLHQNEDWVRASEQFFKMTFGRDADRNSKELSKYKGNTYEERMADYGLKQMAGFNYNLGDMVIDSKRLLESDQETKEAFIYMLDQYDNIDSSWHTAKQAGWEMFTDVTNWAGLLTLGAGAVVSQTSKLALKQSTREMIKTSIKNGTAKALTSVPAKQMFKTSTRRAGALGGIEGGLHAGAMSHLEQIVRIDAGQQSEYSNLQTFASGGIGVVAGASIGSLFDWGISSAVGKFTNKQIKKEIEIVKAEMKTKGARAEVNLAKQQDPDNISVSSQTHKNQDDLFNDPEVTGKVNPRRADRRDPASRIRAAQSIDGLVFKTVDDLPEALKEQFNPINTPAKNINPLYSSSRELFLKFHRGEVSIDKLIDDFENTPYTPSQMSKIKSIINASREEAGQRLTMYEGVLARNLSASERKLRLEEAENLVNTRSQLKDLTDHVNAYSGRDLQDIQNHMLYLGSKGDDVTQEMVDDATVKVFKKVLSDIDDSWNTRINAAYAEGTEAGNRKAFRLMMKRENNEARKEVINELEKLGHSVVRKSTGTEKFVEASISGVFSPSTIIYNTVFPLLKNITYPFIDMLAESPLKRKAWKKMAYTYGQMWGATSSAMQAARAAAKYEQTLLTRDPARFLEGGIKTRFRFAGKAGGATAGLMRAYPRLLGATDAFNQEVAAAGALAAHAFDDLMERGIGKGLKGEGLKKYIDRNMQKEINKAYDFHVTAEKVKPIYEKGMAKNLTGKELEDWVRSNIQKEIKAGTLKTLGNKKGAEALRAEARQVIKENPKSREAKQKAAALRRQASDIEKAGDDATLAVQELLYKKDFKKLTGDISLRQRFSFAGLEHGAAVYEDFAKRNPWTKLVGNLFFRTPAWLFQESIRLTPALNALLPNFRRDLAGVNGIHRQARARTEAAVGYAWMLYTISKWGQNQMTGSPQEDFTKKGETYRSSMRPLSIDIGGEDEISFARWEPLRIPATIVINAFDSYVDHQNNLNMGGYPESDSEFVDAEIPSGIQKAISTAYLTALSAIRDSGLTQGIQETLKAIGSAGSDFRSTDDQINAFDNLTSFVVKKAVAPIPSTYRKTQEAFFGATDKVSIATPKDRVIASFSPNSPRLSRQYDFLGNVLKQEAPVTRITGLFGYSTPEGRAGGRTPDQLKVVDFIADLEDLGFGNLTRVKYRDSRFPKKDLRKLTTNYKGTEISVYDAMNLKLRENSDALVKALLPLTDASMSELGSPKNRRSWGVKVNLAHKLIRDFKNMALDEIILQDPKLANEAIERKVEEIETSLGLIESR